MVFNPAPSLYNKIGLSRLHDDARTGLRSSYIFSAAPPLRNGNSQLELELELETRSLSIPHGKGFILVQVLS